MFRRKHNKSIDVTRLASLVADNMAITGDVQFTSGLRVDGRINGNVFVEAGTHGLLVLSEKGVINGSVRTWDAVINGTICGDLEVEHFLELQANARVTGNITYRQMQLECGAAVEGKLVCAGGEDVATAGAPAVMPAVAPAVTPAVAHGEPRGPAPLPVAGLPVLRQG